MGKFFLRQFIKAFLIIVILSAAVFVWLVARQIVEHGYESLFQAESIEFAKFYASSTVLTAAIIGVGAILGEILDVWQKRRG